LVLLVAMLQSRAAADSAVHHKHCNGVTMLCAAVAVAAAAGAAAAAAATHCCFEPQ
jgi:hypothetical protein